MNPGIGDSAKQDTHNADHPVYTSPQPMPEEKKQKHVLFRTDVTSEESNALTFSDHDASHSVTLPQISRNLNIASHDVTHTASESTGCKDQDGITLPAISGNANTASHDVATKSENGESSANANQLSIFQQLEQTICSEDEEGGSGSSNETSSGEEDGETAEDSDDSAEMAKQPSMPDLEGVTALPLPAILHYMKESESMASKYFSLQNRAEVDRRKEEAKLRTCLGDDEENSTLGMTTCHNKDDSNGYREEIDGKASKVEEDSVLVCHFCGKNLPRRTLLADTQDINKIKEEVKLF